MNDVPWIRCDARLLISIPSKHKARDARCYALRWGKLLAGRGSSGHVDTPIESRHSANRGSKDDITRHVSHSKTYLGLRLRRNNKKETEAATSSGGFIATGAQTLGDELPAWAASLMVWLNSITHQTHRQADAVSLGNLRALWARRPRVPASFL
ncbi:uncharacterized protein LY79DRAFT_567892 [Colletotrichum navitas]|uniref:Uncharacterized protein n=1 Tax=Colletotrichum navitas TaxID=681940 RepID=A0AAD8PP82_9PEZI|nr:uncharacterized protein LY79DRAFT_567892 [Colletotrichum navitas]KAK1573766.1 hypothetical protein LY79DRAFT_567892 [Colletotrichum navitas]